MASEIAQCRLRVEHASLTQEDQSLSETALLAPQPDLDNSSISASKDPSLLKLTDHNFSQEIRLKWMKAITELFMAPSKSERSSDVREFDLILKPDGTVKNLIDNSSKLPTKEGQLKVYPARYRIPSSIISRLDSGVQKARRTERFAMGCIHYELISGNELFPNLDKTVREEEIQACYVEGRFPDDVWSSPMVVRVLACWCPEFAKELLESKGNGKVPFSSITASGRKYCQVSKTFRHIRTWLQPTPYLVRETAAFRILFRIFSFSYKPRPSTNSHLQIH